jgi:hypothetical protein
MATAADAVRLPVKSLRLQGLLFLSPISRYPARRFNYSLSLYKRRSRIAVAMMTAVLTAHARPVAVAMRIVVRDV